MSKETLVATKVIFTCNACGKTAIAGSKDLLENWTKGGTTEGKDERGIWRPATRWDRCGDCSD